MKIRLLALSMLLLALTGCESLPEKNPAESQAPASSSPSGDRAEVEPSSIIDGTKTPEVMIEGFFNAYHGVNPDYCDYLTVNMMNIFRVDSAEDCARDVEEMGGTSENSANLTDVKITKVVPRTYDFLGTYDGVGVFEGKKMPAAWRVTVIEEDGRFKMNTLVGCTTGGSYPNWEVSCDQG